MPAQINFLSQPGTFSEQEKIYIALRSKEGRLLTDEALRMLPEGLHRQPLKKEWSNRKESMKKLKRYLHKGGCASKILDLGCGNGWMANQLASGANSVWAMDTNLTELQQGFKVFGSKPNLHFTYADILKDNFQESNFDVIILAASIQYFQDPVLLLKKLRSHLAPAGEIHIIDSPFYEESQLADARRRSADYYSQIGYPQMINYYNHHSWNSLAEFSPVKHRNNLSLPFLKSPFPWLIIKNN
jgi:ubiquinone/menaquinone biosynthesis C-methylase UbiE